MSRRLFNIAKNVYRLSNVTRVAVRPQVAMKSYTTPVLARSFGTAAAGKETFLDTKEVTDRILEVIKNFEKVNAAKVSPSAKFKEDLDLDSLDAVEVVMAIEEEFSIEIPDSEADKILSIPDAVAYISSHPMAK